jgi:flagellar protein FlbB
MIRAQRQRIIPLIFLNLILLLILLFVLDHFGVFSWRKIVTGEKKKTEEVQQVTEDPYLLEKEALRKQWMVLEEKERLYEERQKELEEKRKLLEEKLKEAENQMEIAKKMQVKQTELKKQYEDRMENVRNLASKISNMPPKDGVALLERMDAVLAVDVIRQMDRLAQQQGRQSITDYLLSIMDREKASHIIRLMSRYPTEPDGGQQAQG